MSIPSILDEIGDYINQLEQTRAVLAEVEHYFDGLESAKYLPYHAKHIQLLIIVADGLLCGMLPDLEKTVKTLNARRREAKSVE